MALDIWGGVESAKRTKEQKMKEREQEFLDYYDGRTENEGGGDWVYAWGMKGLPTKIGYSKNNPYLRVQQCITNEVYTSPEFDMVAFNVTNKNISRGDLENRAHFLAALTYGRNIKALTTKEYGSYKFKSGHTEVFNCSVEEASEIIFKALRLTKEQADEATNLVRLNIERFLATL
jgi:hypothetical protein